MMSACQLFYYYTLSRSSFKFYVFIMKYQRWYKSRLRLVDLKLYFPQFCKKIRVYVPNFSALNCSILHLQILKE